MKNRLGYTQREMKLCLMVLDTMCDSEENKRLVCSRLWDWLDEKFPEDKLEKAPTHDIFADPNL